MTDGAHQYHQALALAAAVAVVAVAGRNRGELASMFWQAASQMPNVNLFPLRATSPALSPNVASGEQGPTETTDQEDYSLG
jgi:hypothetical protein